jgi:hypothetical protein
MDGKTSVPSSPPEYPEAQNGQGHGPPFHQYPTLETPRSDPQPEPRQCEQQQHHQHHQQQQPAQVPGNTGIYID